MQAISEFPKTLTFVICNLSGNIFFISFSFEFITSRTLEDEQGNTKPLLRYLSRSWLLCNQVCMYIRIFVEFPFACKLLRFYKDWIDKY